MANPKQSPLDKLGSGLRDILRDLERLFNPDQQPRRSPVPIPIPVRTPQPPTRRSSY